MTNFDKPLSTRIHPGKKKTFVDDEVKRKSIVPDAKYNLSYDWAKNKTPNFNKEFRGTIATDIEKSAKKHTRPEAATYKIQDRLVHPRVKGAFNLKGNRDDTSFLAEPMVSGHNSPRFYEKSHSLVEKRITAMNWKKPINEKLDAVPIFLRGKKATHLISPASHNPLESMKSAVMPNKTFYMRKGSPKSYVDMEVKRTKNNPGAGHYDIKKLNSAYDKITLGAGKGWK